MSVIYEGQEYHVHGPEKCPRRCSVCPDGNHHWLEEFACEPGCDSCGDDECSRWHEASAVYGQDCWYVCKHCSAWVEAEYVWALEEAAEVELDDQDEATGWLCGCGNFQDDGFHCDECLAEPPWGCDCSFCDVDVGEDFEDDDP